MNVFIHMQIMILVVCAGNIALAIMKQYKLMDYWPIPITPKHYICFVIAAYLFMALGLSIMYFIYTIVLAPDLAT